MGKTILITGNSGKTVFAYQLAALLSGQQKVVLLSADGIKPASQMLFPLVKRPILQSVGKLLSMPVMTRMDVMDHLYVPEGCKNLGLLSYAPGESAASYPHPTEGAASELHTILQSVCDVLVVDTQTVFSDVDRYFLSRADAELCITTADFRGLAWRTAYKREQAVHVLYLDNPYNPAEDIARTFPSPVKFHLPYCKEFRPLYNGVNITDLSVPAKYRKVLQAVKEVLA